MTTQSLTDDGDIFSFALCVQFVANIAATALTAIMVDEVRGARLRPVIGINRCTAHIADLGLRHFRLLFGAGGMLLFRTVFLAESSMAIGTAPKSLFITFPAAACRV